MISVIVPIYNAEKRIKRCLDSIVVQTYSDLQIILIDDGSTDSSGDICDEYAKKDTRFIVAHQKNSGVSAARNRGLRLAAGDYVMFVDSDDYIDERYCEALYELAKSNAADVVVTNFTEICEGISDSIDDFALMETDELLEDRDLLFKDCCTKKTYTFLCWAKLVKKDFVEDACFNSMLRFGEDTQFIRRILWKAERIWFSTNKGYFYVRNPESVTISDKTVRRVFDSMVVSQELLHKCKEEGSSYINLAEKQLYDYIYSAFTQVIQHKMGAGEEREKRKILKTYYKEVSKAKNTSIKVQIGVRLFIYAYPIGKLVYSICRKFTTMR